MESVPPYQLVVFLDESGEPLRGSDGAQQIDSVPTNWVSFIRGKLQCKFLPPPYTYSRCRLLVDLVESQADPPDSWPYYPIQIRGVAKTIESYEERLDRLKVQPWAFTSDADTNVAEKANCKVKILTRRKPMLLDETAFFDIPPPDIEEARDAVLPLEDSFVNHVVIKGSPSYESSDDEDVHPVNKKIRRSEKSLADALAQSSAKSERRGILTVRDDTAETLELERENLYTFERALMGHRQSDLSTSTSFECAMSCEGRKEVGTQTSNMPRDEDTVIILAGIKRLAHNLQKLDVKVEDMRQSLIERNTSQSGGGALLYTQLVSDFYAKYNLELPHQTIEAFMDFDNQLHNDREFQQDLIATLPKFINSHGSVKLSLIVNNILKRYFTGDVANHFSGQGRSSKKRNFSATALGKCIMKGLLNMVPDTTERSVKEAFTSALVHAKDWGGGRQHVKKARQS